MAGGKETPRQKMIGLMYLVLLALLALQVGAEIMVKFLQLNNSLQGFVTESQTKSGDLITNIKAKVAERGNKAAEVKAMKAADELHKTSSDLINFIEDKMKKKMIADTDGYMEDGVTPIGMKNSDIASQLFLGDKKGTALGKEFEKKMDDYIVSLNKIYDDVQGALGKKKEGSHYASMTFDGKEDPDFKNNEDQRNKKFLELAFDHTPMIAALAFLTEKQSKIASYEKEILEKLKGMVGASDFKFDEIFAAYKAESSVVAAGTKYKAQMFISATSSAIVPTMKWGQGKKATKDIPENKIVEGVGSIEFTAAGGGYDKEGKAKRSWTGEISLKHPLTGKDTTFNVKGEYTVSKPVIQIQSASVSALYKNCGNELNVQVPALGSLYQPSFGVTGASKKVGSKKGLVTIIPTAPKVTLSVSSGGNLIGKQEFKVRLVPKPDIVAKAKGKEVDQKRGMKAPGPRSIKMMAVSDPSFKQFLPKDARYKVTSWEAILVRGKRPVNKKTFKGPDGNLASFASIARPGDRILIEVKKVVRRNFLNKNETVKIGTTIMNIPLTD